MGAHLCVRPHTPSRNLVGADLRVCPKIYAIFFNASVGDSPFNLRSAGSPALQLTVRICERSPRSDSEARSEPGKMEIRKEEVGKW
ncbi:hypothetical protein HRbin15_02112 [bacterium HR15]|nr:hypothetical protein HRbin15_02112 [bacterium HR15]